MNASELYQAGQLPEAIDAAIAEVKAKPSDGNRRFFLAELLCFAGDLERAERQLDTLTQQVPENAMLVLLFRNLLRGETARQQFYSEGRVPEVLFEVSPAMQLHLQASVALRENDIDAAASHLSQSESQRTPLRGKMDDVEFDDFRDLDDLTSCFFEVLTSTGKYYWVPMDRVMSLEFSPPSRPLDLLWRSVLMDVADGPDGQVYLPVLYSGSAASPDSQLKLGRGTDWSGEGDSVTRGCGQRMFLVGEEAVPILQLTKLQFNLT